MLIDSGRIKAERQKRAWSQQHLASVTGLGLRTVQRIEKEGTAAYDSAQALAACFEVPLEELRAAPTADGPVRTPVARRSRSWLGMGAGFIAGAALMSVQWVLADDLVVDIGFTEAVAQDAYQVQLRMTSGESSEVRLPGERRVVITPRIFDDGRQVLFDLSVYLDGAPAADESVQPFMRPALVTLVGQEARVTAPHEDGVHCIALRARLLPESVEPGEAEDGIRTIEPLSNDCAAPRAATTGDDSSDQEVRR